MAGTLRTKKRLPRQTTPTIARSPGELDFSSVLGLQISNTAKLIRKVKDGLPYSAWEHFTRFTGIPNEVAARIVHIPLRTLSRRKDEGRLQPDESDRLVRVSRIFFRARELFGMATPAARQWLTTPAPALGGATPLEYASTEVGSREVETLIGRLEHGIPS